MVIYNGKSFDVAQSMLDAAIAYVDAVMPHAKADVRTAEIEKMLGKGVSLAKKDAKAQADEERETMAQLVRDDSRFQEWALKVAKAFKGASDAAGGYVDILGFIPIPKRSGEGYHGQIPLDQFDPRKLIPHTGEFNVKILLNDKAPSDSDNPADYHAYVEVDLPDLDMAFADYRQNRQKALDVAMTYGKDIKGDWKPNLSEDGSFKFVDPGSRGTGEKRESTGTVHPKGAKIWAIAAATGKRYEGSNSDVFAGMKMDGVVFPASAVPASIQNGQISKKLVSEWGWL